MAQAQLTATQIKNAKPADKPYRLTDGGGLHLFITKAGGKLWRWRYELAGKEKLLSIGKYPAVSLAEAREARDAARAVLATGRDPSIAKKQKRLLSLQHGEETFEAIAREWHKKNIARWVPVHADDVLTSLERDVFPGIGKYPVREVTVPDVLSVVRGIEERGSNETARRVRQRIAAVFDYAIASGRGTENPAIVIKGAMAPLVRGRQPAVTDLKMARDILARTDAMPGSPITKLAHRLLALTAVRPGTLISTPWSEFPEGVVLWTIPAARLKMARRHKETGERDHIVPLSSQALDVIKAMRDLTGLGPLVFPNSRNAHAPMTEGAMRHLLNKAGFKDEHVSHGWRAAFSTIMNERFPADRRVIDLMLGHTNKDEVEAAYNRAAHLPRRIELAQIWADLIAEGLTPPANLVPKR